MNFIQKIQAAYGEDTLNSESGDLVQNIIIIAGFAIASILAVNFLTTAILNKGVDTANCIEGSSSYTQSTEASAKACNSDVSEDHSFTNDSGYQGRYGESKTQ